MARTAISARKSLSFIWLKNYNWVNSLRYRQSANIPPPFEKTNDFLDFFILFATNFPKKTKNSGILSDPESIVCSFTLLYLQKITLLQVPQLQEQPQQPSLSYDE